MLKNSLKKDISIQVTLDLIALESSQQRNVLERTCSALSILLQQVFTTVENDLFAQVEALSAESISPDEQLYLAALLGELSMAKAGIETVTIQAVLLAYVELAAGSEGGVQNGSRKNSQENIIEPILKTIEALFKDSLNLAELLAAEEKIIEYTNQNRPLLIYISAQLHSLFEIDTPNIVCNPLAPKVLIHGFILGLRCATVDVGLKQQLFNAFENVFLSQLPSLLNNIINRLEQEDLAVSAGVAFDEHSAGPIQAYLDDKQTVGLQKIQAQFDRVSAAVSSGHTNKESNQSVRSFLELANEDSRSSALQGLCLAQKIAGINAPMLSHINSVQRETDFLVACRKKALKFLNQPLQGLKMPALLKTFYQNIWQEVLFSALSSDACAENETLLSLQNDLLQSVQPVGSIEAASALGQQVPALIRSLRQALERASISNSIISEFLSQLKQLHLQNLQQKLLSDDYVEWIGLEYDDSNVSPVNAVAVTAYAGVFTEMLFDLSINQEAAFV